MQCWCIHQVSKQLPKMHHHLGGVDVTQWGGKGGGGSSLVEYSVRLVKVVPIRAKTRVEMRPRCCIKRGCWGAQSESLPQVRVCVTSSLSGTDRLIILFLRPLKFRDYKKLLSRHLLPYGLYFEKIHLMIYSLLQSLTYFISTFSFGKYLPPVRLHIVGCYM